MSDRKVKMGEKSRQDLRRGAKKGSNGTFFPAPNAYYVFAKINESAHERGHTLRYTFKTKDKRKPKTKKKSPKGLFY